MIVFREKTYYAAPEKTGSGCGMSGLPVMLLDRTRCKALRVWDEGGGGRGGKIGTVRAGERKGECGTQLDGDVAGLGGRVDGNARVRFISSRHYQCLQGVHLVVLIFYLIFWVFFYFFLFFTSEYFSFFPIFHLFFVQKKKTCFCYLNWEVFQNLS